MCLSNDHLKFPDMTIYIAPGFSYDTFQKAYGCEVTKGHFPYEYMDCLEMLDDTALPPKEIIFSQLKNEDYTSCQDAWRKNGMTTLRSYLVWYNNRDSQTVCLLPTTWHCHVQARHQRTWSDITLPVQFRRRPILRSSTRRIKTFITS